MEYCIYKYVENNEIIYIGQTIRLNERIYQHSKETNFINFCGKIFYFVCNNQTEMNAYEYFLINKYQPKYNKQFKNKITTNLLEPEWIQYEPKTQKVSEPTNYETISITEDNKEEYITIKEFADLQGITVQAIYKPGSRYQPYIKYSPELRKRVINKKAAMNPTNLPVTFSVKNHNTDKINYDNNKIIELENIIEKQKEEIEFLKKIINTFTSKGIN